MSKKLLAAILLASCFSCFLGIACTGLWFTYGAKGVGVVVPRLKKPESPREMAERIKANGADIRWATCNFGLPAMYLVRAKDFGEDVKGPDLTPGVNWGTMPWGQYLDERRKAKIYDDPVVILVLYPTEQEAKEQSESTRDGFSWGKFGFFGEEKLLKEIKAAVR